MKSRYIIFCLLLCCIITTQAQNIDSCANNINKSVFDQTALQTFITSEVEALNNTIATIEQLTHYNFLQSNNQIYDCLLQTFKDANYTESSTIDNAHSKSSILITKTPKMGISGLAIIAMGNIETDIFVFKGQNLNLQAIAKIHTFLNDVE